MSFFNTRPITARIIVLSQAELDAPTAAQLADYSALYMLEEEPYTLYRTDGTVLVGFNTPVISVTAAQMAARVAASTLAVNAFYSIDGQLVLTLTDSTYTPVAIIITAYTYAQMAALEASSDLILYAIYVASDSGAWYRATAVDTLEAFGGTGGGGGSGYLGSVASQGAMTGLTAVVGDECLRSDLGTGGLRYELAALPATTAGNWQPVQGTLANGTMVTIALVDGKLPRRLLVFVASGCQVTVVIGGVTQPVLVENVSGQYHIIDVSDDPGATQPTTLTIQRTSGSGATSTYSLEAL